MLARASALVSAFVVVLAFGSVEGGWALVLVGLFVPELDWGLEVEVVDSVQDLKSCAIP